MRHPTPLDRAFQLAYIGAYRVLRVFWRVTRIDRKGALVALFVGDEILLVKNSYVDYYSLPGGYVHRRETHRVAAARELLEEVGIALTPESLTRVPADGIDGLRANLHLFTRELADKPALRIDHREVVAADWYSPERALALPIFPAVRSLLLQRSARVASSAS